MILGQIVFYSKKNINTNQTHSLFFSVFSFIFTVKNNEATIYLKCIKNTSKKKKKFLQRTTTENNRYTKSWHKSAFNLVKANWKCVQKDYFFFLLKHIISITFFYHIDLYVIIGNFVKIQATLIEKFVRMTLMFHILELIGFCLCVGHVISCSSFFL